MPRDDPEYKRIIAFRAKYPKHGYYIAREFRLKEIQNRNGSITKLLIQKKSEKIVSHMLNVYDAIWEAHTRIGHLSHDKTIDACSETHYSPTQQLVRIFCQDCLSVWRRCQGAIPIEAQRSQSFLQISGIGFKSTSLT